MKIVYKLWKLVYNDGDEIIKERLIFDCYRRNGRSQRQSFEQRISFSNFCSKCNTLLCLVLFQVLMIARYHRHRIARAIFEVTLSAQVTITHQKNPFLMSSGGGNSGGNRWAGRSASASVLQLVGSLIILYTPYYTLMLWQALGRIPSQGYAVQFLIFALII